MAPSSRAPISKSKKDFISQDFVGKKKNFKFVSILNMHRTDWLIIPASKQYARAHFLKICSQGIKFILA